VEAVEDEGLFDEESDGETGALAMYEAFYSPQLNQLTDL
jgi:hypothetical protein